MPIQANVTNNQITATVGETQIDVAVSGGVGPSGASGVVSVAAPITNTGTASSAAIGLSVGSGLVVSGGSLQASYGTTSTTVCAGNDSRLSDAREWSASTVSQAEAEAGTSTSRLAFTPLRVFQAIAAWWAGSSAKTKLDGIATGATANATDAQLRDRSTHTGTQSASTISDFTTAVIAAAPPTTNASLLTSGTLPDARLSANIARTSDVTAAVANVVNAAPAALDTLNELAAALGNDASFSTTVTNALAAKAPLASPTFTGTVGGITKSMVGLGNVDNTSDASKPVSTAQAAADAAVASAAAADATSKANAAQAAAVQRANHTGTQAASTITGLATVATSGAYSDLSGTPAAYLLPTASGSTLGGVKIGSGVSIDGNGVISVSAYSLPAATTSTLGGVIVGTGLGVSSGTVSVSYGTTSGTACQGNDSRLSDARTPLAHNQAWSTITSTPTTLAGYGITDAVASSDSRLTDARTPTAGSVTDSSIASGGLSASSINWVGITAWAANTAYAKGDLVSFQGIAYRRSAAGTSGATFNVANWQQITPSEFVASQITSGTVATARLGSGTASASTFLRGDGTWATAGSTNASDLTTGTLAFERLPDEVEAATDIYLWSTYR